MEYAPFQRIPKKKKKKDPKCSTIESDPIYQEFIEYLTKEPETENQPKLEYSYPITDRKFVGVMCCIHKGHYTLSTLVFTHLIAKSTYNS